MSAVGDILDGGMSWATAAPQPATHEPSLASRLGRSGGCQAQRRGFHQFTEPYFTRDADKDEWLAEHPELEGVE